MWQSWMRWKMPLCKWHTFWMAPCLICYFVVKLFYIERKWLLMRNLATILPLKSKLSGKFQLFNAIERSINMFNKILLRLYVFGTKSFLRRYTEIYKHLLSKCCKNAALWRQEMVQPKCFFWHQTQTCLLENL